MGGRARGFLRAFVIVCVVPLAGCAAMSGAGGAATRALDPPTTFIVFFGFNSVELDEVARSVVGEAAEEVMRINPGAIRLAGYIGEGPDPRASDQLTRRRFMAVEDALVAHGIDRGLFLHVPLPDDPNLPDIAVRRVEIRLGPDAP